MWGCNNKKSLVRSVSGCILLIVFCTLYPFGGLVAQVDSKALSLPSPAPTVVTVSFFLSDINGVSETDQTFEFEGIVTLLWKDQRQAFDPEEAGVTEKVYQGPYQFLEMFTAWWPQLSLANESGGVNRQGQVLKITPDGTLTYVEEINATAVTPMNLRRFPFDQQVFEVNFAVLGFSESEVQLEPGASQFRDSGVELPQWTFIDMETRAQPHEISGDALGSNYVVGVRMERNPWHMLRIVVLPLTLLVMLSWSVFWMDLSSVGDRMDISFIGILTVVAYQIIISDHMPKIAYFTLMSVFLYSIYLMLAATIVVNLRVAHLDKSGRLAAGDRLDLRCRWLFPVLFFGFNAISAILFLL
jgi:hypothetical protein